MVCCELREVPGQQFVDAVDGVICDLAQDVPQVAFGIKSVELG